MKTAAIGLSLEVAGPLVIEKLRTYATLYEAMDKKDGWLKLPDSMLNYLNKLGVTHWAELYSMTGQKTWIKEHQAEVNELFTTFADSVSADPTPEGVNQILSSLATSLFTLEALPGLEFLSENIEAIDVNELEPSERNTQCEFWVGFFVYFYNDLSLATHGESLVDLVTKAIDHEDDQALVKAVQIDRTLLAFFQARIDRHAMNGNSDFYDALSYRIKNSPRRGANKYPLLWILFKDLMALRCLKKSLTCQRILDLYEQAVMETPQFKIDDELIVQRQRRNFMKMYSQRK